MPILITYAVVGLAVLIVGGLFMALSRATRHARTCAHCGERVTVEQMNAHHCPACGSDLGPKEQP